MSTKKYFSSLTNFLPKNLLNKQIIFIFTILGFTITYTMELILETSSNESNRSYSSYSSSSQSCESIIDFNQDKTESIIDLNRYDSHVQFELLEQRINTLPASIATNIINFKLAQCVHNTKKAQIIIEDLLYDLDNFNNLVITIGNLFDNSETQLNELIYDGVDIPDYTYERLIRAYIKAKRHPDSLNRLISLIPQTVLDSVKTDCSYYAFSNRYAYHDIKHMFTKYGINDEKLLLLTQNGIDVPDTRYLDLITSYDRHNYYPASFKKLLKILPKHILNTALTDASMDLIPILIECGADTKTPLNNHSHDRKALLESYNPELSWKKRFMLQLQIQCSNNHMVRNTVILFTCVPLSILGLITTGLILLLHNT
ncbi:MAG TPA: hypothetical protein PLU71_01175 [Candidatus Dependentiae bacterium]|nr:hypothetical protein [Candidatus Dependentiae bacterium]HRQ62442.1 hypothetical protein [Candidatus Dependentiae bacterium]